MAERRFKNLDDAAADAILQLIIGQRSFPREMFSAADNTFLKPEFANAVFQDPRDNTFFGGPNQILEGTHGGDVDLSGDFPPATFVHTHPPTPDAAVFSQTDKDTAAKLKKPIFMSQVDKKGQPALFKFDPKTGKTEEVLAQFPIERLAERLRALQAQRNPIAAGNETSKKRNGRPK